MDTHQNSSYKQGLSNFIRIVWLIVIVSALAGSPLSPAPAQALSGESELVSLAPVPWRDDFDDPTLDMVWAWTNENPAKWSLTENPGFLRIYASHLGAGAQAISGPQTLNLTILEFLTIILRQIKE